MTFLVTLTCVANIACGLTGSKSQELMAPSHASCISQVKSLLTNFGQDPKHFNIICDKK